MKNYHYFYLSLVILTSFALEAHCPAVLKEEKVCFMLEKNILYIYDSKLEHDGPYKDLVQASLIEIKDENNSSLQYKKLARGIMQINATKKIQKISAVFLVDKKKKEIVITHEN